MSEEREYKNMGDSLASQAVEDGLSIKQLRTLYKVALSQPIPKLEAHIQYQISRIPEMKKTGEFLLNLIKQHENDKKPIVKVLQYAILVYDYYSMFRLETKLEALVKTQTEPYGFEKVETSTDRDNLTIKVYLKRFQGDPKELAFSLQDKLKERVPQLQRQRFRVWIERR